MQYLLDQIGAVVIAGFIVLMIATNNIRMTDFSSEVLYSTIMQQDVIEAKKNIEFDINKIGYNAPTECIAMADSTSIGFYSDIITSALPEGDGSMDKVYYHLGTTQEMADTPNPNDMPLYKMSSYHSDRVMAIVTRFNLTYYDSLGSQISENLLVQATERAKIRSIKVICNFESSDLIDSAYTLMEWEKEFSPRSLNKLN